MKNFLNEDAIREAAYYIWKNNGCPANTSVQDWNAAINQLSAYAALNGNTNTYKSSSKTTSTGSKKTSACKTTSSVKKNVALKSSSTKKTSKKSK